MRQWVYKGPPDNYDGQIIDSDSLETYKAQGWRECINTPGECETPLELPPNAHVELEDSKDAARRKAVDLGIKVDGRWSESRLNEEIAKHEAVDLSS